MRRGFFHSCQGDPAALAGNYVQMCQEGVTRGTERERAVERGGGDLEFGIVRLWRFAF